MKLRAKKICIAKYKLTMEEKACYLKTIAKAKIEFIFGNFDFFLRIKR